MAIFKGHILNLSFCENDYGNEVTLRVSDAGFAQSEYFSRRDSHSDVVSKLRHLADKLEQRDLTLMRELVKEDLAQGELDPNVADNCVAQS